MVLPDFAFRILRSIEISVCFWIVYPKDQISARAVNKQESRLYSDSATQLLFLPVPMAVLPTVSFGNSTTKFQNRVTVRISVTPFNVFIRFWPNCPLVARPSKKIYTLEHFLLAARSFFPEQQTNMWWNDRPALPLCNISSNNKRLLKAGNMSVNISQMFLFWC